MSRAKRDYSDFWVRVDPTSNPKEGGHGRGFLVRRADSSDSRIYFLKELKDNGSLDRRRRFKSEVVALKKLRHRLIAEIVDDNVEKYSDKAIRLYFVSLYFEGGSLRELIENKGFLSLDEALGLVLSILNTLAYCHAEGVVHRDLKPDNVVLNAEMQPVLIDFGQSWMESEDVNSFLTPNAQQMGNRFLVLPECTTFDVSISAKRDKRSDVTLCAALLLYLLTGIEPNSLVDADGSMPHQRPLTRESLMQIDEPVRGRLMRIFDTAFQHRIELRFWSADALRDELSRLLEPLEIEDSGDLFTSMQSLVSMPSYQLRAQALGVMDSISDGLGASVEEISRQVFENQFDLSLNLKYRSPEAVSHQLEVRHRVMPELWLSIKIVFRLFGSEITAEVSACGKAESLYRCRLEDYEGSEDFKGVFEAYLERLVSRAVKDFSS